MPNLSIIKCLLEYFLSPKRFIKKSFQFQKNPQFQCNQGLQFEVFDEIGAERVYCNSKKNFLILIGESLQMKQHVTQPAIFYH